VGLHFAHLFVACHHVDLSTPKRVHELTVFRIHEVPSLSAFHLYEPVVTRCAMPTCTGRLSGSDVSSGVYICKSVVNYLRHGNYICKSEGNYLTYEHRIEIPVELTYVYQ
jgi:hypothetical protein